MNFADVVVLSIIAAIVACILIFMRKKKKNGPGCCSGCSECSKAGNCPYIKK